MVGCADARASLDILEKRKKISLAPVGIRNTDHPSHGIVTITTELSTIPNMN
jgi:hypothetical protein